MATIIGIPAGKMIRTSVNSDTDDMGLSRLTESYAFATSEFETFRARFKNLTPYNTIMTYVSPLPTTSYPYVTIDSVSIAEGQAGISTATIQYVGILKSTKAGSGDLSWLPPAKQKIQPYNSASNPVSVIVDFIYYSDIEPKDYGLLKIYGTGTSLPPAINGTNLYRSIRQPFVYENRNRLFDGLVGTATAEGFVATTSTAITDVAVYYGMLCVSHFSERVGLFYKVTNTYQDSGFSFDGTANVFYGATPIQY
jgi:hypothetical protein